MSSPEYPPRAYLGIDPGASGALALLHGNALTIYDMPLKQRKGRTGKVVTEIDTDRLWAIVRRAAHKSVEYDYFITPVLEQVGGLPRQGAASAFQFGRVYGQIEMACVANGLEITYAAPTKWKADARLIGKDKAASCALAAELWPQHAAQFFGPRGGLKDGRAEAALLARFGQRTAAKINA